MSDAPTRKADDSETALLGDAAGPRRAPTGGVDADALLRRLDALAVQRRPWEPLWQDLAEFVLPRRAGIARAVSPGEAVDARLFDATAIHANDLLAAALHSMLTNPATPWFGLRLAGVADEALDAAARDWLQAGTDALAEAFAESNLATQLHELYLDLGCFGTGLLYLDAADRRLRFSARPLGEAYVAEDAFGRIDTVFRRFSYSARQAAQAFGREALGPQARGALEREPDRPFEFVHAVFRRERPGTAKDGARGLPWASVYLSLDDRRTISESGYHEFPYMAPRWSKAAGEVYGRSPAMSVLPDIRMLNKMSETTLVAAEKAVNPPLLVPDDGFLSQVDVAPGALNWYRAGGGDRIEAMPFGGNVELGLAMEERRREAIRSAFFVDRLALAEGPQMTATEVLQRAEEKLRLMGPMLGRLQGELLRPMIERAWALLDRAGRLPQPPRSLRGRPLDVDYVSPIARAQRLEEVQAIVRLQQAMAPFAALRPELADLIDEERLMRRLASRFGVPRGVLRDEAEVEALRRERAEAQGGGLEGALAALAGGEAKPPGAGREPAPDAAQAGVATLTRGAADGWLGALVDPAGGAGAAP